MTGPDEYESVLGIPPGTRPPNHYELLGLRRFEPNQSVIAAAADGRIVEAEESVMASADHIRQVISEIRRAKACLLDVQAKAAYDRQLKGGNLGSQPDRPPKADRVADEPADDSSYELEIEPQPEPQRETQIEPQFEPQFESLPNDSIDPSWPIPAKKRKSRAWFWTFTLFEAICAIGLLIYLRPAEQIALPGLPVRARAEPQPPQAGKPTSLPAAQPSGQRTAQPQRAPKPARGPFDPRDPFAPDEGAAPGFANAPGDNGLPAPAEPDPTATAMTPPPSPAKETEAGPPGETPAKPRPPWPSEWKLSFPASGDWAIDNEMLSLSADEIKALAALRELPIYTLRDVSTKKPTAVLPFDNQGHLSGIAVALLPKNDWRACLSYHSQVLQGWAMVLDAQQQCVCFADYRAKGRRLLCLCAGGIPIAVQIWRGKESAAYLIELADGRPVALDQKQLSPEQTERLAAALAELASIEATIRDCERDWKPQLTEWWTRHDNALKLISAQSIADGEKQSRKAAYYKNLFDEQHAGLDKLLAQFGYAPAEPGVPAK